MKDRNLRRSALLTVFAAAAVVFGIACEPKVEMPKAAPTTSPATTPATSPADSPAASRAADKKEVEKKTSGAEAMVGRWPGPEGTYLNIAKSGTDTYTIEIKNLDGVKQYHAKAGGGGLEFTRNGKTETVKAATGAETGVKDFEKETNCLLITRGSEGFCKKP